MRITFTGSHSTGKTTVAKMLVEEIEKQYPELFIDNLGSVTRELLTLGGEFRDGKKVTLSPNTDRFQLACIYKRREWMLMPELLYEADVVISERWALDETAYQLDKVKKKGGELTLATYNICENEVQWEIDNYWDIIYYLPVSSREVEDDGVRDTDRQYQLEIDKNIQEILKVHEDTTKIRTVPVELADIIPFLKEEVSRYGFESSLSE